MAIYSVAVKRGALEYSVSGEDREFLLAHIDMIFSELKDKKSMRGDEAFTKLDIAPVTTEETAEDEVKDNSDYSQESEQEETLSEELSELTSFLEPQEVSQEECNEEGNEEPELNQNLSQEECEEDCREDYQEEYQEDNQRIEAANDDVAEDVSDFEETERPVLDEDSSIEEEVTAEELLPSTEETQTLDEGMQYVEDMPSQDEIVSQEFDFENILEDKLNNPTYVEENQDSLNIAYEEAVLRVHPDDKMDYLVITAYYMLENENQSVFQLKQLNAKLFNTLRIVVDRKTVQKALEDNLLEIVSDGSDNDGIVEYSLTQTGKEYYATKSA